MKKKFYTLFAILISLLVINVVKAANIYDLDWQTQYNDGVTAAVGVDFNGGYATVDYTPDGAIITSHNLRGQKIKEKNIGMYYVYELTAYEDELYVMGGIGQDYFIARYDKDFNQIKKISIGNVSRVLNFKKAGISILRVDKDNVLYFDGTLNKIIKLDRNLENPVEINLTEAVVNEYEPMAIVADSLPNSFLNLKTITANTISKNSFAIGVKNYSSCDIGAAKEHNNVGFAPCAITEIYYFDSNGQQKWSKQLNDYDIILELRYIDNYLAVVAVQKNSEKMDILIYDEKGNLVQTISSEAGWMNITDTNAGFMVTEGYCSTFALAGASLVEQQEIRLPIDNLKSALDADLKSESSTGCCSMHKGAQGSCVSIHKHYYLVRSIETKVNKGKGTVQVAKSSKPGEPVTFTVTPEPGYVLGEVRVTDANGKVLIFKDYTFTMPNADVLVEAEFLPANPETKDIAIVAIAILALAAGAVIILQRKKLKEIN